MTVYDLLFILLFLGSVVTLPISVFVRRRGSAKKILLLLAAVWGIYFLVLAASDMLVSQRVTRLGEERCFDEMCFAITGVQTQRQSRTPANKLYIITVRVTSHSLGRTQAEGGVRARLYEGGRFFNVSEQAQQSYEAQHGKTPKLTQKLAPGESILSVLLFDLPANTTTPALTLDHGFTPGYFIIGESPFFHKPDILQLPVD